MGRIDRHHPNPLITAGAALAIAAGSALPAETAGAEADGRALVERFIEEVLSPGRYDRLEEFLDAEDAAEFRKTEELRRSLFPDLRYRVEDMVADGDRVVVRYTVTGTHTGRGESLPPGQEPLPPTERSLEVREVALFTVDGGRLHQEWALSDKMAVARTLGYRVTPPPGGDG